MVLKPCKKWDKLPTSTGSCQISSNSMHKIWDDSPSRDDRFKSRVTEWIHATQKNWASEWTGSITRETGIWHLCCKLVQKGRIHVWYTLKRKYNLDVGQHTDFSWESLMYTFIYTCQAQPGFETKTSPWSDLPNKIHSFWKKIRDFPLHGCGLYLRSCVLGWEGVSWSLLNDRCVFGRWRTPQPYPDTLCQGFYQIVTKKSTVTGRVLCFFLCLLVYVCLISPSFFQDPIILHTKSLMCISVPESIGIFRRKTKKAHCYRQGPRQYTSYLLPWKLRIHICFFSIVENTTSSYHFKLS